MKDYTVVITGASAGFGEAIAHHFAKEGAKIIALARRKDRLSTLKKELESKYQAKVHVSALDVMNVQEVERVFNNLPEEFAKPNVLINNAGMVKGLNKVWETPPEDWDQMIDTNIKGVLNLCSQVIPKMITNNEGHVINIGSISGYDTYAGGGVYCATKYAVRAITDTLRKELVATPIRVSLVSPGMAETEFSVVRFSGDHEKAKDVYKGVVPLTADDIAEVVLFIAQRPPNVNIGDITIYPKQQASTSVLHRGT